MTAIGKLLVLSSLVAGLGILTWSASVYAQRPGWFAPAAEVDAGVDKGNRPVGFAQLKAETDALARSAGAAGAAGGAHLKVLEAREKLRAERKAGYAQRIFWAYKGNPNDPVDKANPKSPGKGFYEPVIDPATKLHDLTTVGGIPKGKPVLGTDGAPLPGLDGLLGSVAGDRADIIDLNEQIKAQRTELNKLSEQVSDTVARVVKMGEIRDSVQGELFFLDTFEVNVFETRETVFRRERQLRNRLKVLGVTDP